MKSKKSKQELTRLILTALILGGGCLYGPVAEADPIEKEIGSLQGPTDFTSDTWCATGMYTHNGIDHNIFYAVSDAYKIKYNSNMVAWNNYDVAGGFSNNLSEGVSNRQIWIAGGNKVYMVYGGLARGLNSNVTKNSLSMTAGTADYVFGGYSLSGIAGDENNSNNGNTVSITGGKVNYDVYGGFSYVSSAFNNKITISGSSAQINGIIYGGFGKVNAKKNRVTISNGTIKPASSGSYQYIYGGYAETGDATGNEVILSGGTFDTDYTEVIAGNAETNGKSATGNSVTLNGTINIAQIFGGRVGGSQTIYTNNTLNLGKNAQNNVVKYNVNGFDKIATASDFAFSKDRTVLRAGTIGGGNNVTLDIHGSSNLLGDTDISHYGTMTLLSSTNGGLGSIKLNYNNTAADIKAYESKEVASSSITNDTASTTVRLDGTRTHTVANSGSAITYTIANNISKVTFGNVTWGTTPARTLTANQYNFGSGTTINKTNLAFTDPEAVSGSMTLVKNATGMTALSDIGHTQDFTKTVNGATLSATLSGNITRSVNTIGYTATGKSLKGIDLTGWNGTAYTGTLSGYTSALTAESIIAKDFGTKPTVNTVILDVGSTNTGFFQDSYIKGAEKYSEDKEFNNDEEKGVTFSGKTGGGVKATDSGTKLTYFASLRNTKNIALGDMTWGTGRVAGNGYNFGSLAETNPIVATNLKFTNPLAVGAVNSTMALLSDATDLVAGKTVTGASHTQNFTDVDADNKVKLSGTINGTVSTAAKTVNYKVTGKSITGADLAGWDSTKSAFSLAGWTNGFTAGSINAAGFTAPDVKAGQSKDILTASNGFFNNDYITGAQKYGPSGTPSSDTEANVTFTGSQEKGVKASTDGTKLQYVAGNMAVSDITLGNMEVGAGGIVTKRTADANYTFDGSTTINATNLTFDKPADVVDSTLVDGATGITSSNPITGASHSQAITNAAMGTGGITVSGTLNGTVSAVDGGVNYTVNNKTVSSMDLSGWDTTTAGTTLPDTDWTGSNVTVNANSFAADAPTENKTIFTTTTDGFFGDVTGALAYKSGAAFSGDADAGVTLSGTKSGGVKKSDDGKNLNFIAELKTVNNIALGTMNWGTSRTITGNYDFSDVVSSGIDASKLSFTGFDANTIKATDTMTLLTGAKGLGTGLVAPVSPSQSLSYDAANGAALSGTLKGTVSTEAVDAQTSKVTYTVDSKTLDSVNLSNWDGNNTDLDTSWSKNANDINVSGSGFTAPTTIGDTPILTASNGFFNNAIIANNIKYQPNGSYSETDRNITLSGSRGSGVKANDDGSKLVYSIGAAFINNLKLGTVDYTKGGTWLDKSDPNKYNFSNLNSLDTTGFSMSMTDDQKKSAALNDTMTLVKGTTDLPDITAKDAGSSNYTYAATNGLTVGGTVSGSVSASNHDVLYKVTDNKVTTLSITDVAWDPDNAYYNRDNSQLDYKDAVVDSSNIFFSGVSNLSTGDVMTLISNYGSGITKTRGGIFTLENGKTGKGTAYYEGGVLKYKVTLGAGEVQPAVSATNNKAILIIPGGQEHQGTVTGGEAKGDGDSTDNEQGVKGKIITNTDGTGGDVNGGTSEEGYSRRNKADVEDSTIEGDVNGGKSENGNSTDNEAEVDHSNVGGDVNGGKTDGDGETKGNEANVKNGSKVTGTVMGGRSGGNGDCTGNAAEVEGSEVGGDVNGGQSDGNGNTRENKTHVKDSKVTGNVIGGHSGQNDGSSGNGESTGNTAEVEGSEVGGNVNGGKSEGTGNSNENKTTVEGGSHIGGNVTGGESNGGNTNKNETTVSGGSTVNGDVTGGKNNGDGTANENKTNVSGSNIGGDVTGGQSKNGATNNNDVTVNGGSVGGDVTGGKTENGSAYNNNVTLDGGADITGKVYGGFSQNGSVDGNVVTVKNATVRDYIYGGKSAVRSSNDLVFFHEGSVLGIIGGGCDEAVNNQVTLLKGGVEEHVIGGFANTTATGNKVTMTGGTVNGSVIGGYASTTSDGNSVYLGGGTVKGETFASTALGGITINGGVYGGYTSGTGTTENNNVYIFGDADVSATSLNGGNNGYAGNKLYVGLLSDGTPSPWTGGGQLVNDITNFEAMDFSVVPWSTDKTAINITDGSNSDLSMTTVSAKDVTFTGTQSLNKGASMTLLDQSSVAAAKQAVNVTTDSKFKVGVGVEGTGTLSQEDNGNVIYTVDNVSASEQTHNTLMGAEAGMVALAAGNDFINSAIEGLGDARNMGDDGISSYAKIGGGQMKQETGSHINVNTWNAILALGHKNVKKESTTEYGAFFEYGTGNYTTHNGDLRGDGSVRYTGGGVLGKWEDNTNGFYVEGGFRAGTVHEDANNLLRDANRGYSYSTDAPYKGFHIGVGKKIAMGKGNTLDLYAKYIFNRKDGVSFNAGGNSYRLDDVTSQIIRLGGRYTMKRDKWNFYAGAAYEHELDGRAHGWVDGIGIRGADIGGGSFRGELGATVTPDAGVPLTLDFNLTGYAGNKQGISGGLSLTYSF